MSRISDIKQWLKTVSNNRSMAMIAGMEHQVEKLPPDDPRTMMINELIVKKRAKLDRELIAEEEGEDESDSQ